MHNPFKERVEAKESDKELIQHVLEGNKDDLKKLILRHQAWIYNIAFRMVCDSSDAEDITQEILIKMMTKLSTYDPQKSSFRTWLYRIVANHVINMRNKKYEKIISDFCHIADYFTIVNGIQDDRQSSCPENDVLARESRIRCLTGVLLCLNRQQRLVFILGALFNVPGPMGSEILELSRPNFRQILSRARKKVYSFLNENCGLINEDNPCRCPKQIKNQIQIGWLNPDKTVSHRDNGTKIDDIICDKLGNFEEKYYSEYIQLFRGQPFYEPPSLAGWINKTLGDDNFKDLFHLAK